MGEKKIYELQQVLNYIKSQIEGPLEGKQISVKGVISDLKRYPKYTIFELYQENEKKERVAKVKCMLYSQFTPRLEDFKKVTGFDINNDMEVCVVVNVSFHPVFGLNFNVRDIDPYFTLGGFESNRQLVLKRLLEKGLIRTKGDSFESNNQVLKLKAVIQKIAVVSSSTAEGYKDFIHEIRSNPYRYTFEISLF